jgi:hypothetical protein
VWFPGWWRAVTDAPRPEDPRDALIRDQAERIAVLEGMVADLRVARSHQQKEILAAPAERVQHDLHRAGCACERMHVAPRPAGVPDSALPIGPRLQALAVYLVVFQHVPAERCRQLIAWRGRRRHLGRVHPFPPGDGGVPGRGRGDADPRPDHRISREWAECLPA